MKALLAICMLFAVTMAIGADNSTAPVPTNLKGKVLEVRDVESYTYLRLETKSGEVWAAVSKADVKKGGEVAIDNVMLMKNFESKSLKKTFDTIYFGTLAGATGAQAASPHGGSAPMAAANIRVPKATGANAKTVAEIIGKSGELKDKPVLVSGQVVKYSGGIMGKNWVHLQDGSGSAADKSNDILVTTLSEAKIGDVVTVKGIVHTNKDFGSGYAYGVLIEEAVLQH